MTTWCLPAPRTWTGGVMWALNPALIPDFPGQHSITRASEFWTEPFWMIGGSGKTFPGRSHSVALCLMPTGILASWFRDAVMGGAIFPLVGLSSKRCPLAQTPQTKMALPSAAMVMACRSLGHLLDAGPLRFHFTGFRLLAAWCTRGIPTVSPRVHSYLASFEVVAVTLHSSGPTFLYSRNCHGYAVTKAPQNPLITYLPRGPKASPSLPLTASLSPHVAFFCCLADPPPHLWFQGQQFPSQMQLWITELRIHTKWWRDRCTSIFFFYEAMD